MKEWKSKKLEKLSRKIILSPKQHTTSMDLYNAYICLKIMKK